MRFILRAVVLILAAALLSSCASMKLSTPSGSGVDSSIGRVGSSVADAKKYNDLAVIHNANASTRIERIRAKSVVIQKFWGK